MSDDVREDSEVTAERVRWFADRLQKRDVVSVLADEDLHDLIAYDIDTPDMKAAIGWFNGLTPSGRAELLRRVVTLMEVRKQDAPPAKKDALIATKVYEIKGDS